MNRRKYLVNWRLITSSFLRPVVILLCTRASWASSLQIKTSRQSTILLMCSFAKSARDSCALSTTMMLRSSGKSSSWISPGWAPLISGKASAKVRTYVDDRRVGTTNRCLTPTRWSVATYHRRKIRDREPKYNWETDELSQAVSRVQCHQNSSYTCTSPLEHGVRTGTSHNN